MVSSICIMLNSLLKKSFSRLRGAHSPSLRAEGKAISFMPHDKLLNLGFKEINNVEIAASRKTLLAMTLWEFFAAR